MVSTNISIPREFNPSLGLIIAMICTNSCNRQVMIKDLYRQRISTSIVFTECGITGNVQVQHHPAKRRGRSGSSPDMLYIGDAASIQIMELIVDASCFGDEKINDCIAVTFSLKNDPKSIAVGELYRQLIIFIFLFIGPRRRIQVLCCILNISRQISCQLLLEL